LKARTIATFFAAFVLPTVALAADVSVFGDNITIARADFSSVDGCIVTSAEVLIVDERESFPPGRPTTGTRVEVGIAEFNQCTQQDVSLAFGGAALSDDEFHIGKKLASASVTKIVEMTAEATGATFEVSVDVSWTATSPATNTRLRFFDHSPDGVSHSFEKATARDASISGSVLVGTTDLLSGATVDLADIFTRAEHGVRVDRSAALP